MKRLVNALSCAVLGAVSLLLAGSVSAATYTWSGIDGDHNDKWNTTDTNWNAGVVWADGNDVVFTNAGVATVDIDAADVTADKNLTVSANANVSTISGSGGDLKFSGYPVLIKTDKDLTISADINQVAGTGNLRFVAKTGAELTIDGKITHTTGGNSLYFGNPGYTGTVTLNGDIQINWALYIDSNSTVDFNHSGLSNVPLFQPRWGSANWGTNEVFPSSSTMNMNPLSTITADLKGHTQSFRKISRDGGGSAQATVTSSEAGGILSIGIEDSDVDTLTTTGTPSIALTGQLSLQYQENSGSSLTLTGADTYTGTTTIGGTSCTLVRAGSHTGLVGAYTVGGTSTVLQLKNSSCLSTNTDIYVSAANSCTINLDFTGTNTIHTLYIDGVAKFTGIYGASSSSALTGTGYLRTLAPDPKGTVISIN